MQEILPLLFLHVFTQSPLRHGVQAGQVAPEALPPMLPRGVEAEELPHTRLLVQHLERSIIIMSEPVECQTLLQVQRLQLQLRVILEIQPAVILPVVLFLLLLAVLVGRELLAQLVRQVHVFRPQMVIMVEPVPQTVALGVAAAAVQPVVAVPAATPILQAVLVLWQQ